MSRSAYPANEADRLQTPEPGPAQPRPQQIRPPPGRPEPEGPCVRNPTAERPDPSPKTRPSNRQSRPRRPPKADRAPKSGFRVPLHPIRPGPRGPSAVRPRQPPSPADPNRIRPAPSRILRTHKEIATDPGNSAPSRQAKARGPSGHEHAPDQRRSSSASRHTTPNPATPTDQRCNPQRPQAHQPHPPPASTPTQAPPHRPRVAFGDPKRGRARRGTHPPKQGP